MTIGIAVIGSGMARQPHAAAALALLDERGWIHKANSEPRGASFDEGVHNMEVLASVTESAARGGASIEVAPQRRLALQESGASR